MTTETKTSASSAAKSLAGKYLTFRLGAEFYCVEVTKIREIIRLTAITVVPQMAGTTGVATSAPKTKPAARPATSVVHGKPAANGHARKTTPSPAPAPALAGASKRGGNEIPMDGDFTEF